MNLNYLDFEQPIAELQQKIEDLRNMSDGSQVSLSEEIQRLESKQHQLTEQIFSKLEPWQVTQLARHPQRPYALDYIQTVFTDWEELHGDRAFSDDPAIVSGIARLDGRPVVVIGQQKGRDAKERIHRNFGMPMPEGYRKALRLMKMGEKFSMPVLTFIDTPGAFPGIGAEERNQSEAIARNLFELSRLRTPVVATVIGEGGSGGALAIGVGDHLMMLQLSIYSVISPEGCASILFKSADRARDAAEAMKVTAQDLLSLKLIDEIIPEPLGGAHRDMDAMCHTLRERLEANVDRLCRMPVAQLVQQRQDRLMQYGVYQED
ncbi:acetyl-CoA carboxylase carboxyltransferase subunit alpha [Algiphilus sp.]|uniref:acetyl-CoA carboxylase carboxyltransferase subunit alpha n=1 Tax=Algiphilus sp. TaxID=1872431 RepID=UPI001CA693C6|nr:acetyl-CoA carboxylase carboxyltransferase subunit alpha [Algiphilus sp.]MBY8965088.1 acetyl-CoA carboxylase carboxyltransferase subunit alpha [Algiphilus acroporae]MCI5062980.1 acetyl-CoA carboxylase carboxyltransferase subunit alpha [Algiphilus sp.]MCI5104241.1 acetyl-CoA carboxylase carboxyltransferase subunit alpha [Algiphilus sp.]MCR9090471.1 acetyl-CoA carboxylase carboxyltransferase subunit alpha [Pseudomonadota bacterium]